MKQETEPFRRPFKKQEGAKMNDVLAQMHCSGGIHFFKSLRETAIQTPKTEKCSLLALPTLFVQENCDKIEEWVILRAQLSCGKSSRPWLVRLNVSKAAAKVRIGGGWHSFVAGNRLKKGDSLIFLLKEDARSEFEVHMFRGPQGSPYFPDELENSPIDDEEEYSSASEEEIKQSRSLSPRHDHVELNKAFPRTKHLEKHRTYPGFRKRLTASSIRRSNGDRQSGQFEFPWSFLKTHGDQIHGSVKLQGIYENSPTYLVTCHTRRQQCMRVNIVPQDWSRFVQENGLKNGHELQFSLIDESYFVVRKV